jgi:hypothetical protein
VPGLQRELHGDNAMTKIEQRRKLIEAATQGEWKAENGSRYSDILVGAIEEGDEWGFVGENLLIADAALIVAAVNDYAALLEIAEALKDIYPTYSHAESCEAWDTESFGQDYDDEKCNCGLVRVAAALAKFEGEKPKSPSQKMADAGFTRRPSGKAIGDDE